MKIAMPNQRGTNVIVRDIKRQYHVRRVWDFGEDAVYVTDESGYQKLSLGQKVVPVGFPRQDVFEYYEEAVATADWLRTWCPAILPMGTRPASYFFRRRSSP